MLASIFISEVKLWNSMLINKNFAADSNEAENSDNYNINEIEHTRAETPDLNDEIFRDNENESEMVECF
jgi:hypothetical protein